MTPYRIVSLSLAISLLSLAACGQTAKDQKKQPSSPACPSYYDKFLKITVFTKVELEAEYPGGSAAWQRFLNKNFHYPTEETTEDEMTRSTTVATFVVKADGTLCHFGIRGNTDTTRFNSLDKAFLAAVKQSGKWSPAMCNGKAVASAHKQPIVVHIETEE